MPEARDWMRRGEVRDAGGSSGFWIRRAASPVAVTRSLRVWPDDKENMPPPGWTITAWRRQRPRKSPLPEWYPRTPLRDITAIVNALERRRIRMLAARDSQMNHDSEASPQIPLPTSPSQELSVSDETPNPTPIDNTILSPTENMLPTSSTPTSPTSNPPQTPTTSTDLAETERKLSNSIDKIERVVKRTLKRNTKEQYADKRATQRRTLMSMR